MSEHSEVDWSDYYRAVEAGKVEQKRFQREVKYWFDGLTKREQDKLVAWMKEKETETVWALSSVCYEHCRDKDQWGLSEPGE